MRPLWPLLVLTACTPIIPPAPCIGDACDAPVDQPVTCEVVRCTEVKLAGASVEWSEPNHGAMVTGTDGEILRLEQTQNTGRGLRVAAVGDETIFAFENAEGNIQQVRLSQPASAQTVGPSLSLGGLLPRVDAAEYMLVGDDGAHIQGRIHSTRTLERSANHPNPRVLIADAEDGGAFAASDGSALIVGRVGPDHMAEGRAVILASDGSLGPVHELGRIDLNDIGLDYAHSSALDEFAVAKTGFDTLRLHRIYAAGVSSMAVECMPPLDVETVGSPQRPLVVATDVGCLVQFYSNSGPTIAEIECQ